MRHVLTTLAAAGALATALAGCTPPHPHPHISAPLKVIARLDCPDEIGDLTRTAQTSDGLSCSYKTDEDQSVVDLKLVTLAGADPKTTLAPIEADLRTELPPSSAEPTNAVAASSGDHHDEVHINVPGVHINVDDHGANINGQGATVSANDHGAEIRHESSRDSGVNIDFLLVSENAGPHGYHAVGYTARGPVGGPLVVATVRQKDRDDGEDVIRDARKLLRHNVG